MNQTKLTFPQKVYLDLLVAREYPNQEPEYKNAKWYHLFWLFFPIFGFLIFIEIIRDNHGR